MNEELEEVVELLRNDRITALDQPLTLLTGSAGLHRSVQAADRHRVTLLVAFPPSALHQRGLALCSVHRCT